MFRFFILISFLISPFSLAQTNVLFTYKKKEIQPVLAKTVKAVNPNRYEIGLDLSQKVDGKALTAEIVKSSLEGKLGKKLKLSVTIKAPSLVVIDFKGSEKVFLAKIPRTKISSRGASLTMNSTVADTGIRAKEGKEGIGENEIQLKVLKIDDQGLSGLVLKVGSNLKGKIKKGKKLKLVGDPSAYKKGKKEVITPVWQDGVWNIPK